MTTNSKNFLVRGLLRVVLTGTGPCHLTSGPEVSPWPSSVPVGAPRNYPSVNVRAGPLNNEAMGTFQVSEEV